MSRLEYGIRKLSDARLRYVLRTSTGSNLGSMTTGVVTTAILQSSSMVSLLVLAFASAGLVPLVNAIGILLGANLGTTFTGWIVATFGFKLDLEALALPLFGMSAFILALCRRESRLHYFSVFVFGVALLLFGLGIMKTSMEGIPQRWDVAVLQGHHAVVYLLFGIFITFLVQSSSAVMMMALAALNAEFIALPEAAALIIGADLGTTSTTALGSLTGSSIKRKLAFAHIVFNFVVDISAFIFLLPFLPIIMSTLSLTDPLYSLVAFHSIMNLIGLLAFIPFLNFFANWVEKVFSHWSLQPANLLDRVPPTIVDAALAALSDTVHQLMLLAACNSLRLFGLKPEKLKIIDENQEKYSAATNTRQFDRGYEEMKNQEGEILGYCMKIQRQSLEPSEVVSLEHLQLIVRHVVFAVKNLKDIEQDLNELKLAGSSSMPELYEKHKQFQKEIYENFIALMLGDHDKAFILEELEVIRKMNDDHSNTCDSFVQASIGKEVMDGTALSIQFNVNREIRHAVKTMIKAMEVWVRMVPAAEGEKTGVDLVVSA